MGGAQWKGGLRRIPRFRSLPSSPRQERVALASRVTICGPICRAPRLTPVTYRSKPVAPSSAQPGASTRRTAGWHLAVPLGWHRSGASAQEKMGRRPRERSAVSKLRGPKLPPAFGH